MLQVKVERVSRSRSLSSDNSSVSPPISNKKLVRKSFQKTSDNGHFSTTSPKAVKRPQSRYEATLNQYLEKRPHLNVVTANTNPSALLRADILDDDDVWLFQSSHNVDVEKLIGHKLHLNDRPNVLAVDSTTNIEYHADLLANNKYYTAISKSANNEQYEAFSFRLAGVVRIQNEIPAVTRSDGFEAVETDVPYPQNLKVRHPLLGYDFEKKTELNKSVRRSLREAVVASNIAKCEKLVKTENAVTKKKRSSEKKMELDFDTIMGLNEVTVKAETDRDDADEVEYPKRKKRKVSMSNIGESPRKKHKSKSIKPENGGAADLDWLSSI